MSDPQLAAFTDWAERFLSAKQVPMDKDMARIFLKCSLVEDTMPTPFEELQQSFSYKVLNGRLDFVGLSMTESVKIFLCALCESPGDLVMYVYAIKYAAIKKAYGKIDMQTFSEIFMMGFPSKDSMGILWDLQKMDTGGNLLDKLSAESLQSIAQPA